MKESRNNSYLDIARNYGIVVIIISAISIFYSNVMIENRFSQKALPLIEKSQADLIRIAPILIFNPMLIFKNKTKN